MNHRTHDPSSGPAPALLALLCGSTLTLSGTVAVAFMAEEHPEDVRSADFPHGVTMPGSRAIRAMALHARVDIDSDGRARWGAPISLYRADGALILPRPRSCEPYDSDAMRRRGPMTAGSMPPAWRDALVVLALGEPVFTARPRHVAGWATFSAIAEDPSDLAPGHTAMPVAPAADGVLVVTATLVAWVPGKADMAPALLPFIGSRSPAAEDKTLGFACLDPQSSFGQDPAVRAAEEARLNALPLLRDHPDAGMVIRRVTEATHRQHDPRRHGRTPPEPRVLRVGVFDARDSGFPGAQTGHGRLRRSRRVREDLDLIARIGGFGSVHALPDRAMVADGLL